MSLPLERAEQWHVLVDNMNSVGTAMLTHLLNGPISKHFSVSWHNQSDHASFPQHSCRLLWGLESESLRLRLAAWADAVRCQYSLRRSVTANGLLQHECIFALLM